MDKLQGRWKTNDDCQRGQRESSVSDWEACTAAVMFGGAGEGPMISNDEYSLSINRILQLLVLPLFSTRSLCRRISWLKGFLSATHGIFSQAIYRGIVWFLALGFYGRENGKILRIEGGDNIKETMFSRCNRADAHVSSQWCDSMHKICTSFVPTKFQD